MKKKRIADVTLQQCKGCGRNGILKKKSDNQTKSKFSWKRNETLLINLKKNHITMYHYRSLAAFWDFCVIYIKFM